jgi:hypothetical protein
MTEPTAIELEELAKAVRDAHAEYGGLTNALKSLQARTEKLSVAQTDYKDIQQSLNRAQKEYQEQVKRLNSQVITGRLTQKEYNNELKRTESTFKAVLDGFDEGDASIKALVASTKAQTLATNVSARFLTTFNKQLVFGSAVLGDLKNSFGKIVSGIQGNQTDIQMAGTGAAIGLNLMKVAVSTVAQGFQIAGTAVSTLSLALGPLGKIAGTVIGSGLNLFGKALDAADKKVYELANAALPILTGELDKAFNSFNAINSSGAVFANGLSDMVIASKNVNLLLPEFASVLKENSVELSSTGLGMVQAAKQMGQVGIVMRTQGIADRLKLLGITVKDQAELITDTMSSFAATNRLRGASEESLARFTDNYATSLKVLSGITGEDAKKAIEKNRRASFQADVYAAISAKGPEALKKFQMQLELFNKQDPSGKLADAYSQTVSGITTVTDPATRFLMENQDVANALQTASAATLDNNVKMEDAVVQTTGAMGQMRESLLKNPEAFANIAAAARAGVGGMAADISTLVGNIFAATGLTNEAADAAKKNVDDAQTQTKNLTTDMLAAATAGRKFAEDMQDLVLSPQVLGSFAKAITFATKNITDAVIEFIKNLPGNRTTPRVESTVDTQNRIRSENAAQSGINLAPGNILPRPTNPLAAQAWDINHGALYNPDGSPRNITSQQSALTGASGLTPANEYARGGIVSGPTSGFPATLHGSEAVIPLPDGVSGPEFAQAIQGLARSGSIVSDTAAASQLREQISGLSNDLLSSLNTKIDDLISATKDVAQYTKETSVRIM